MNKLIGITTSTTKNKNKINNVYFQAFNKDNLTPILIPCLHEHQNELITPEEQKKIDNHISTIAKTCDALILSGGQDLNPILINQKNKDADYFNHNRDLFEAQLAKKFIELKKPIFGICRGFQLLGNMLKLDNFKQNLSITGETHSGTQSNITDRTEPMHTVHLFGEFKEYLKEQGLQTEKLAINSWHYQGFTLRPSGKRVDNKDIQTFVEGTTKFNENYELKTLSKITSETEKPINNFDDINVIMSTNHVLEGFEHKTLPIMAVQNHPEENTNSIIIKYFINKYLESETPSTPLPTNNIKIKEKTLSKTK